MSASPIPFASSSSVLSPPRPSSTRPISRPSSRNSVASASARPPSPGFLDDTVAIRNQMSTLKHTIRHQQAQYQHLENILLRGPRPLPPDTLVEMSSTTPPVFASPSPSSKQMRRSSYDHLQALAGPNSSLPLPREDGGIKEGIPMSFGVGSAVPSSPSFRRTSSPTRTLSRIPVSAVGNARALADDGQTAPPPKSPLSKPAALDIDTSNNSLSVASNSSLQPPSPNRRTSLTPGGTTKVLADLQAGVINARTALENTKSQLRLSQRTVAQLMRQTEDLKEGRERMRLENEALNNAVSRKERLLQEMLERARKAEAEAVSLKAQLKTETTTSKKTIREMETALAESTALSSKSEREYITLRDSIKQMTESWKSDTKQLRSEMQAREDRWRKEAEEIGKKYKRLVDEVNSASPGRDEVKRLREENENVSKQVEAAWLAEIQTLKEQVQRSSKESEQATKKAENVTEQLARLRRLMQSVGSVSSESSRPPSPALDQEVPPP